MAVSKTIAVLLLSVAGALPASAAVIGVVAPRSGPYASLGAQIFDGARAAARLKGDTLAEIDETCDEAGGAAAAKALTEAKVQAAIGFLCVETLATALPQLKATGIPALTVSVRSKILMEDTLRSGWPFFRLAPKETSEADQLSKAIFDGWKAQPLALVEDGTIYGRELAGAIRQKLEPLGMAPVFTDTFRPGQEQQIALVRRLAKAGATHVFVGGDRTDLSIIARDAASENIKLTLLGGDASRAADRPVPLAAGVLAVALPDYANLPEATDAATALRAAGREPDGYTLPAYAAVQVVQQAIPSANGRPLAAAIGAGSFGTAIGTIAFDANHELKDNPFKLLEWRDGAFMPPRPATE